MVGGSVGDRVAVNAESPPGWVGAAVVVGATVVAVVAVGATVVGTTVVVGIAAAAVVTAAETTGAVVSTLAPHEEATSSKASTAACFLTV